MAKMKKKNLSLISTYVFLMVTLFLGTTFLMDIEKNHIEEIRTEILQKYTKEVEKFDHHAVWDKKGNEYILSEKDSAKISRLEIYYYIFPYMTYLLLVLALGIVYIRCKVKEPLHILSDAVTRITDDKMDFIIKYDSNDEFGELCKKFEKMRAVLVKRDKDAWVRIEERKRLNATFSHDLRTPLTVLEGHMDMLQKYSANGALSETDINEFYSVMNIQVKRMSRYVSSMSVLERLEDIQIYAKVITIDEFAKTLKNTADIICASKKMIFINQLKGEYVFVDLEIVLQVCENLLSNAMRYAETKIDIICRNNDSKLIITISDDGKGFDLNALEVATDPFYTTEKKSGGEHFGLGLNICKILCQKHGGNISLHNNAWGGACITVTFAMKKELE